METEVEVQVMNKAPDRTVTLFRKGDFFFVRKIIKGFVKEKDGVYLPVEAQPEGIEGHHNLIKIYNRNVDRDQEIIEIDMEYCKLGDLGKLINQRKKAKLTSIPTNIIAYIIYHLSIVILHLHKQEIVHRDIKPENILIRDNGDIVLADLGSAKPLTFGKKNSLVGTAYYLDPAIGGCDDIDKAKFDWNKVDIWGIGIVLWCLMKLELPTTPFWRSPQVGFRYFFDRIPEEPAYTIFSEILREIFIEPEKRITINEIINRIKSNFKNVHAFPQNFRDFCHDTMKSFNTFENISKKKFNINYSLSEPYRFRFQFDDDFTIINFLSETTPCPNTKMKLREIIVQARKDNKWILQNLDNTSNWIPCVYSRNLYHHYFPKLFIRNFFLVQVFNIYTMFFKMLGWKITSNLNGDFEIIQKKSRISELKMFENREALLHLFLLIENSMESLDFTELARKFKLLISNSFFELNNKHLSN